MRYRSMNILWRDQFDSRNDEVRKERERDRERDRERERQRLGERVYSTLLRESTASER